MRVMNLGGPELVLILCVVVLLFGARKLPELARSVGQAKREFERGTHEASNAAATTAAIRSDDQNPS
jgi:sec-independent protein translocase protein TatA